MFKHSKLLVLSALAMLTLAACGGNEASSATTEEPSTSESPASTTSDVPSSGGDTTSAITSSEPPVVTYGITTKGDNATFEGLPKESAAGETITFTVTAATGYGITAVTAKSGGAALEVAHDEASGKYSFTMPSGDVEIEATAEKIAYAITATGEHVTYTGLPATATMGETVSFTAAIESGHRITAITAKGGETALDLAHDEATGAYSFTMPAATVTIAATTEAVYAITVTGNITVTGLPEEAAEGETVSFSAEVIAGYKFSGQITARSGETAIALTHDEATGIYSFTMPAGAVEITAETEVLSFNITTNTPKGTDGAELLTVTAYEERLGTEAARAEYTAIAGSYGGTITKGWSFTRYVELDIDCYGNWRVASYTVAYSGNTLQAEFTGLYGAGVTVTDTTLTIVQGTTLSVSFTVAISGEDVTLTASGEQTLGTASTASSSYGTVSGTLAMTAKGAAPEEGVYVPYPLEALPTSWEYQSHYYLEIKGDNYYGFDAITVDGAAITPETEGAFAGFYKIEIPAHDFVINITATERKAAITIEADPGFTVTSYIGAETTVIDPETLEETTTVTYTEATEAAYNDDIYFKIEAAEGYTMNWADLEYRSGTVASSYRGTDFVQNADGYWTAGDSGKMIDMDFGMTLRVYGGPTSASVQSGYYFEPGDTSASSLSGGIGGTAASGSNPESIKGENFIGRFAIMYWWTYQFVEAGATEGELIVHAVTDPKAHKGWYDGDGLFLLDVGDTAASAEFVLVGSTSPTVNTKYDGDDVASSNILIQELSWTDTEGEHFKRVLLEIEDGAIVDVDFEPTITYSVGEDTETVGNIFRIAKSDGTDVGLYKVSGTTTMEEAAVMPSGAYTPADGTLGTQIVVGEDGLSLSYGVSGSEIAATYVANAPAVDGEMPVSFLIVEGSDVKLYTVTLDTAAKTFSAVEGKPFGISTLGEYRGAKIYFASSSATSYTYYPYNNARFSLSASTSAPMQSTYSSLTTYSLAFTAEGDVSISNGYTTYTILLSEDGESAYAMQSGSWPNYYIASKSISSTSSNVTTLLAAKYGDGWLMEIKPSSTANGERNYDVLYITADYSAHWTHLEYAEGVDWSTNGAAFTVDGVSVTNNNGTIVAAE